MKTAHLQYDLPQELIAQYPVEDRAASRLLLLNREDESIEEDEFRNIGRYLNPDDCLVLNDTKVIRARLRGRKKTGGQVEIFLLRELEPGSWEALVRPSARIKPDTAVFIGDAVVACVEGETVPGRRRVRFNEKDVIGVLEATGEIPLPPYIHRESDSPVDAERYQTVYANEPGAVAAPTAGLHFTDALLNELREQGIPNTRLTLHVGYGTFKPIQVDDLTGHALDEEWYRMSEETAALLNLTRQKRGRVLAVGTTSTRVLETCFGHEEFAAGEGWTNKFIYPPYTFRGVDALLTNFHLPRSSLLALVSAFAGQDFTMRAYKEAVRRKFRFYSYGDAMLIR